MNEWWCEFFTKDISDEAAFHLVNIVSDFAAAVDSHYFGQAHRYMKSIRPSCDPQLQNKLQKDIDGVEEPF